MCRLQPVGGLGRSRMRSTPERVMWCGPWSERRRCGFGRALDPTDQCLEEAIASLDRADDQRWCARACSLFETSAVSSLSASTESRREHDKKILPVDTFHSGMRLRGAHATNVDEAVRFVIGESPRPRNHDIDRRKEHWHPPIDDAEPA